MKLNTKSLAEVEIGLPVIADGIYHARMEKSGQKDWVQPNKRGDGNNLVIMFRILDPIVISHKEGKEIKNNGQVCITRYFGLTPTENRDPDKDMKELAVAIKLAPTEDLTTDKLEGKVVMIKVEHKAAQPADPANNKKAYPEGNEIRRITPVPEDDTFTSPAF